MPPSPSMRASPGRERSTKDVHKRGRSLEHSISYKQKDDDLILFANIQNGEKEKESFLLQSSDDFDDSLNKLRFFSEIKPVNIPAKGESSDLLNAEGDKNDYEWLLTPPDTPLFPSLDDDPPPLKVITRGRPQSQTKSLSRSSTMERTQRSSRRSSASPSKHSPSPRSTVSTVQSIPRHSSSSRASSPSLARTPTPTRRSATPPAKPSTTPTRRSASPTPRRISTGSFSSHPKRGISPSPKIHGFPMETPPPPNLRTSLPDRSVSRSRGFSPGSAVGSDSSSRYRRQSMSPTPSRSASSSRSHDRDRFSSLSTGDDDTMDSVSERSNSVSGGRKNIGNVKNRTVVVSKKVNKNNNNNIISVGSAPKRSFDSALWLMDHRKAPQSMFRPLLSSVPTTSFVTAKANSTNRLMFSRNSSVTTSSNASSDHGGFVAPYIDSDHDQIDYLDGGSEKIEGSDDVHEEVFVFDKVDESNENSEQDGEFGRELLVEVTCSKCGKRFFNVERNKSDDAELCEACVADDEIKALLQPAISMRIEDGLHEKDKNKELLLPVDEECCTVLPKYSPEERKAESNDLIYHDVMNYGTTLVEGHKENNNQTEIVGEYKTTDLNLDKKTVEEESAPEKMNTSGNFVKKELSTDSEVKNLPTQHTITYTKHEPVVIIPDLNSITPIHLGTTNTEGAGAGISVLLMERSSSSKWPVIEARAFSTTNNIHFSEPSYSRDNSSILKRSLGHSSASSSVDLGPFRNRLMSNRNRISGVWRAGSMSTGSVSDNMSVSGSSVRIGTRSDNNEDNNYEACNSFDGEESKASEIGSLLGDNDGVFGGERNISAENEISDVMEASGGERDEKILNNVHIMGETKIDSVEENRILAEFEKEGLVTPGEFCTVEISSNNPELPSAKAETPKQNIRRSFTLEEATETILFCSSIIHDIAYKAATIAIENETSNREETTEESSRASIITATNFPSKKPDNKSTDPPFKRTVDARKVKRKRNDTESITKSDEVESKDAKECDSLPAAGDNNVHKKEGLKPPPAKLEAKCNCTIM